MKTILLLTNFTEASTKAIRQFMRVFAPKLADTCSFILLNAYRQSKMGHTQLINLQDYLAEISEFDLQQERSTLLEILPGIKPRIKLESKHGDIVQVLNLVCGNRKPDLIVMGTKGSNIIRELLIGSTTGRIVRQMAVPVLIIPESVNFLHPHRIVLATEMKECKNEIDFKKLTDIVRLFMSEFIILHVYKEEKPDVEAFEACMKKHLEGIHHEFQYISHTRVAEAITEFSANMNADLLAMIGRNENLLVKLFKQSISTQLIHRAELPMLIIHEE